LTEDRLLGADEAPAESVFPAICVGNWQAHVEDLAVVLHIRVVTIGLVGTREVIRDVRPDGGGIAGQGEGSQGSWFRRRCFFLRFGLFWHFHLNWFLTDRRRFSLLLED